jgi:hypothetical protein
MIFTDKAQVKPGKTRAVLRGREGERRAGRGRREQMERKNLHGKRETRPGFNGMNVNTYLQLPIRTAPLPFLTTPNTAGNPNYLIYHSDDFISFSYTSPSPGVLSLPSQRIKTFFSRHLHRTPSSRSPYGPSTHLSPHTFSASRFARRPHL